jgi:hypothetical protein
MLAHGNLNTLDLVVRPHGVAGVAIQLPRIQRKIALVDFVDRPLRNAIINRGDQITFPGGDLVALLLSFTGARFAAGCDLLEARRNIVEALCLAGNNCPVAHALEPDRRCDRGHAQQIPVQADRRDDGIQQPFLLAKPFCPTRPHFHPPLRMHAATIGPRFRAWKSSG